MSGAAFQSYDVSVPANGAFRLACSGRFFRVIQCTGKINVSGSFGVLRGIGAGQGTKATDFTELLIQDASGAANSITIVAGPDDFIDQSFTLDQASKDMLRQPLIATSSWNNTALAAANTPIAVFAPGANVNGAIVFMAEFAEALPIPGRPVFIAKSTAPTSPYDGDVLVQTNSIQVTAGGYDYQFGWLKSPVKIAAGQGLYFVTATASNANLIYRSARYTLL